MGQRWVDIGGFLITAPHGKKRAMKDLWVAFLRARAAPEAERQKTAEREIKAVMAQWMAFNETTIKANAEHVQAEAAVEKTRLECLATIGTEQGSELDQDLQIPFNWKNVPKEQSD